jgi:alkylhydroperoxidase family enzyme
MAQVLEDYESAPISVELRATLSLLKRVTLTPAAVTPEHAAAVYAAGVSREALEDALHVAFVFNTLDRLADTLGWEVMDKRSLGRLAAFSLRFGYA